ncbi:unnamed protein product [Paramecium pentaurelia]|uniref:Uncharacterized protein n=1 Tax=Paramecium pentaurelia TaxID=43138 RepID=A0A8S1WNN5_9CILI|nr:unnamed protein product [Paramecium pentaurelia]
MWICQTTQKFQKKIIIGVSNNFLTQLKKNFYIINTKVLLVADA